MIIFFFLFGIFKYFNCILICYIKMEFYFKFYAKIKNEFYNQYFENPDFN